MPPTDTWPGAECAEFVLKQSGTPFFITGFNCIRLRSEDGKPGGDFSRQTIWTESTAIGDLEWIGDLAKRYGIGMKRILEMNESPLQRFCRPGGTRQLCP